MLSSVNPPTNRLRRLAHIHINSCTERRKARAPNSRSLRACLCSENAPRHTPGRHTIREVVLRPQPFNTALGPAEDGADHSEVLGRGEGRPAHVFQAGAELLAHAEGCYFAGRGGHGGIVAHLWMATLLERGGFGFVWGGDLGVTDGRHEETEHATKGETHCAGEHDLEGTGLCCVCHL